MDAVKVEGVEVNVQGEGGAEGLNEVDGTGGEVAGRCVFGQRCAVGERDTDLAEPPPGHRSVIVTPVVSPLVADPATTSRCHVWNDQVSPTMPAMVPFGMERLRVARDCQIFGVGRICA